MQGDVAQGIGPPLAQPLHWGLIQYIERGDVSVGVGEEGWSQGPLQLDSLLLRSCAVVTNPQFELHFSLPLALLPCNLHSNEGLVPISPWLAKETGINQNFPFKKNNCLYCLH